MARIRTIKPEFFTHWELYQAEAEEKLPIRVAFAGLWTLADRDGKFKWVPQQLKLGCLPYDNVDFSRVLDALATRGFIVKYEVDGQLYGLIPKWHSHQVINNRESESILPDISNGEPLTRAPRVDDACPTPLSLAQGERKGKEGKGKEGERKGTPRFDALSFLAARNVDQQLATDWLTIRKAKRAPNTETAFAGIEKEASKAGLTLADALGLCCRKGWASFDSNWIEERKGYRNGEKLDAFQKLALAESDPDSWLFAGKTIEAEVVYAEK